MGTEEAPPKAGEGVSGIGTHSMMNLMLIPVSIILQEQHMVQKIMLYWDIIMAKMQ